MLYQCNPKPQNEIEAIISKKCSEAQKSGQVKTIIHTGSPYIFERIKMHRDDLYYNLENDRTLTDVEEFIKDKDLDSDYFDKENTTLRAAQQDYHSIITKFIPSNMEKILKNTKDQRDPVYITKQGVMANGNTRLACFRNLGIDNFEIIDCLVFPEELTDNWDFIRRFVDLQDNAEDFSSSYPWHARAKRIQKNIDSMSGVADFKAIAARMQYKDSKEAETHHHMLGLATEFVESGKYEKYSRISDLGNLGSEHGLQVFNTLAINHQKDNIDQKVKTKLKLITFETIATNFLGDFDSQHRAVQAVWAKSNVTKQISELEGKKNISVNKLIGGNNKKKSKDAFIVDPFKDKSNKDRQKELAKSLQEAAINKETDAAKSKQDTFKSGLENIYSRFKTLTDIALKDDSNLSGVNSILKKIEKQLEEAALKVQSIKERQ